MNDINLDIQKAIIFATLKHEGQKRKGTNIPYIVHPMEVMQILTNIGCDDEVIIAGILHDTLEDTDATEQEILDMFGAKVLDLVKAESEDKSKTWKERKQTTIDNLEKENEHICLVCYADKLSNLRSIYRDLVETGDSVWNRFNADKTNIAWYYESLYNLFTTKLCIDLNEYKKLLEKTFA